MGPDGEILGDSGWYRDLWETQHGKGDSSERVAALEKENAQLKDAAAEVDTLKQKHMEQEEEIKRLKEENDRLKQNSDLVVPPPQSKDLLRAKTWSNDSESDVIIKNDMKADMEQDDFPAEMFNLISSPNGRRHFW